MGAGGQWEPHAKFKPWLQKVQDTGGSSSTTSAVLQDMCTSWSRSGNQWGVVMAEQLSQEGHLLRIQHLLRSRVSAHVIQEYGNVGCIIRIMLLEPPVGSDVAHAMGLAAPIFKLSMERPSFRLAGCPSHPHVRATIQQRPQCGPHALSLGSDSPEHQAPSCPRAVTLSSSRSGLLGALRWFFYQHETFPEFMWKE